MSLEDEKIKVIASLDLIAEVVLIATNPSSLINLNTMCIDVLKNIARNTPLQDEVLQKIVDLVGRNAIGEKVEL